MARRGMGLVAFILICFSTIAMYSHSLPYGKVIFVDDDFTNDPANHKWNSIQAAIDDAEDGDIIFIFAGTYDENIFVDKEVKIIGESAESVIIDGNDRLFAFNIISNNVSIENLTIKSGLEASIYTNCNNISIKNCILYGNDIYGMELHGENISVENVTIYNVPVAISISSKNISFSNIKIYDVDWGVIFHEASNCSFQGEIYDVENKSIWIYSSNNITIYNSSIHDAFCGIWLYNTSYSCISKSNISGNKIGLKISSSNYNEIISSNFINNFGYGICLEDSFNNTIHHNNFIGNGINAYDNGINKWNSSVGNYWDDYVGTDANEDGIGDEPYSIGNITDYKPLVYQIKTPPLFVWIDDDFNASTPGWGLDHFSNLQDAINIVDINGKCFIYSGNYGGVEINKSISIIGSKNVNVYSVEGILINAENVLIKNINVSAETNGIKVVNAANVEILCCNVSDAIFGLYAINSIECKIENSNFYENIKGIFLLNSSKFIINGCKIFNNSYFGLELMHSTQNKIFDCQIENNGEYGIYIVQYSNGNQIYHNNFINNTAYDACDNDWNGEYEYALGNYWDDYVGTDANEDGIGDEPYYIEGGAIDEYPLMNKITYPPKFVWVNLAYNSSFPGWLLDHFASIEEAIDNAKEKGGCYIFYGIYNENIIVDKELTIAGDAIVESNGSAFLVVASNVEISGITIRNCWNDAAIEILGENTKIYSCNLYNNYYGIYIKATNAIINGCQIHENTYIGIFVKYTSSVNISNNKIYENNNGIVILSSIGNSIEKNEIRNNFVNGLKILYSQNNIIYHNIFEENTYGIYLENANNNLIHFNDFIGNNQHAYDNGINKWNSSVGNYWDDYVGTDANEDGIGDEPYYIDGYGIDYKPLIRRAGLPIAYFSFEPSLPYAYEIIYFYDNSIDLDGSIVTWIWDFGDGNKSYERNTSHFYADNGIYVVNLTVIDNDGNYAYLEKEITVLNNPPVANFSYEPLEPYDIDIITFNASLSYDIDGFITNYTWDLGDESIAYGKEVEHKYMDNGIYNVTLIIYDDDGAKATVTKQIVVKNVKPTADFSFTPSLPYAYEIIYFYDNSIDLDGSIVTWIWDFGDGNKSYERNTSHFYADNGIYVVNLTVIDNDGNYAYLEKEITVLNNPPVANFSYEPLEPYDIDIITFNASLSYDIDGFITNYTWDLGDESIAYGKEVEHKYMDNGIYNVSLTIKDDDGTIATITKQITVYNVPPTADFSFTPSLPTDIDIIWFEDKSIDIDGSIVNYTWNFGDGTISYEKNPSHTYANNGVYTVTLVIKDDDGAIASKKKQITVYNVPPTADFSWQPAEPTDLETITFISNCSDVDGFIVNYTWNFGNGNYSYGANITYKYADNGIYNVTLIIYDDDGAKATVTKQIVVKNVKPTALFDYEPTKPKEGEKVTFNASNSYDPDGYITKYEWDFDGDGIVDAYGLEATYKYSKKGDYEVILTVEDNDGAKDDHHIILKVKEKERVPGFELFIIVMASAILIFMKRYRKGIWRI